MLYSTAFKRKRDTGRKLDENRERFYTQCLFSTPDGDDHTSQFQIKLKSAHRDTNLRAGTLQPDRTF